MSELNMPIEMYLSQHAEHNNGLMKEIKSVIDKATYDFNKMKNKQK